MSAGPKILVLDIETRPIEAHTWGLWDQNVGLPQILDAGGVMCWAAKWYGQHHVSFRSDHHDGHDTMLDEAWSMIDAADIVVGYNHRAFDLKHLRREWLTAGYQPPSGHQDVDLLQVARRHFKFPSNKLDWVARELGVGQKVQHAGHSLWRGCLDGDDAAWRTMRRYNIADVRLTEEVYDRLRPWMPNHPNVALWRGDPIDACPTCAHTTLDAAGFHYTRTRSYPRWRCAACGALSRSNSAVRAVGVS